MVDQKTQFVRLNQIDLLESWIEGRAHVTFSEL